MKEKKTIIDKVRALVFDEDVKFLDAKTKDGLIVKVEGEALEVGLTVYVISEDGEQTPAPEGTHELEDGTIITLDSDSKISNIEEVVEEEVVEEEKNPLEEKVNNLESKLDELLAKFSEVSSKVEEFSKLPAEDEVVVKKSDVKVSKKDDILNSLSKYRKK